MRAVVLLLMALLLLGLGSVEPALANKKDRDAEKAAKAAKNDAAFAEYKSTVEKQFTEGLTRANLPGPSQSVVEFTVYKTGGVSKPKFRIESDRASVDETITKLIKENKYPEMTFDGAYVDFDMAVNVVGTADDSKIRVAFLEAEAHSSPPLWRWPQGIMRGLVPIAAFFILAVQTFVIVVSTIWIVKQRRRES